MHDRVKQFVARVLSPEEIKGKFIIETGALDVNGSVRESIESAEPYHYLATDMREGPGVDIICTAENLPSMFGYNFADIIICLEMLEHAQHWKAAMAGMLRVLKPEGILVLTTRSPGFPLHGFPEDYWRFSVPVMANIMDAAGLLPMALEFDDPTSPGVFVKVSKPADWEWQGIPEAWHTAEVESAPGEDFFAAENIVSILKDVGIVA